MKLPNWFKIIWWVVITLTLVVIIFDRVPAVRSGTATGVDAFLFLLMVILLLLPLFNEFDFFGVKLKSQIAGVKAEVKDQATQLRNEIVNIGVNTNISPQIYLTPPADSQIPELERKYQNILNELKKQQKIQTSIDVQTDLLIPHDTNYLFVIRYSIEKELRRIWRERLGGGTERRPIPMQKILSYLREAELVEPGVPRMIQEVYSVCSPAIHGEEVSDTQVGFVRDIAPDLIASLIDIK